MIKQEHHYISKITLDEKTVLRRSPEIEMERHRALSDMMASNTFSLMDQQGFGPFSVHISIQERNIIFSAQADNDDTATVHQFPLPQSPFRRIIKDYFIICENFYDMAKKGMPHKMEALDMGRRGLHNEGADILIHQLSGKINLDHQTARQLFTLICVLHIRVFTN